MTKKRIIIVLVIIIALIAIVWHRSYADTTALTGTPAATTNTDTINNTQQINSFCPDISQLKKDPVSGRWSAQNKAGVWKSYDMSFATDITQFSGAQWVGVNIGQITCVYQSEQRYLLNGTPSIQPTIPIMLVFHTLSYQPTQGKWKTGKVDVINCFSAQQQDCPFQVQIKVPVGNIYQEAAGLKSDASQTAPTD